MSEMDDLKKQRIILYQRLKISHNAATRVQSLATKLKCRFEKDKSAFEECDRKLALLDGRFKVELPNTSGKGKRPLPANVVDSLTPEQIAHILEKFGVAADRIDVVDHGPDITDDEYEEEGGTGE